MRSPTLASPFVLVPLRPARRVGLSRTLASLTSLGVCVAPVKAQIPPPSSTSWEVVVPSGTLVPTGGQRRAIQRGGMNAAQVSFVARPDLAFTTSLGWARTRDVTVVDEPKLDVFSFDAGVETRGPRWFTGHRVTLKPFAGIGGGLRRYDHRKLDVRATHHPTAYASLGGELGAWRLRLRLEARDYVSRFRALNGSGPTDMRNDAALMAGLRYARR